MGPSWGASEATLESCWAFLAQSWVMFGHSSATCGAGGRSLNNSPFKATAVDLKSVAIFSHLSVPWGPHGALLKPPWSLVWLSWRHLGPSLAILRPPGELAGAPWAILFQGHGRGLEIRGHLEPSWSLMGASWGDLKAILESCVALLQSSPATGKRRREDDAKSEEIKIMDQKKITGPKKKGPLGGPLPDPPHQ